MAKMSTDVFKLILVITLLHYSEKCNCETEDAFVSSINNNVQRHNYNILDQPIGDRIRLLFNRNQHRVHPIELLTNERDKNVRAQDLSKELSTFVNHRKAFFNTLQKQHRLLHRRLARQAYPEYKPSLYPTLPTPPTNYHRQPYYNNNLSQSNQTSYTPPYNSQWRPTNMHNYSQPGYPAFNGNSNGNNYPGNPSTYNPTYPRPSAPFGLNPANNPIFGHAHGHQYPYTAPTNYSNFGPQNPSGYQPPLDSLNFNNRPSNWSSNGIRNNSFAYNPSQRPPYYPPSNSTTSLYRPSYPSYSTTQRYSVPSFNTTQRTPYNYPNQFGPYNNSQPVFSPNGPSIPGYNNGPPLGGHQGPYNNAPYYPNHNVTGFQTRPLNSSYPDKHQTWPYNSSHDRYRPNAPAPYPSGPYGNNFTNNYNSKPAQTNFYGYNLTGPSPNSGIGYNGHNNFTRPFNQYPGSTLPGSGFYLKPQYNGTSAYNLADYYTPNIPNQPPRKDNFGQDNSFYPSNVTPDPTRVSPNRFSY